MKENNNSPQQSVNAESGSTIQNVIQAIIHLPAWAWIIGTVILSLTFCITFLLGIGLWKNRELISTYQYFQPTPTAFAPASENESLIIVADFEGTSNGGCVDGLDPAQQIYNQLEPLIQKVNIQNDSSTRIRVEHLLEEINDNSVQMKGDKYNATLVLWGTCDSVSITPKIKRIKPLQEKPSSEEGKPIILLADRSEIDFGNLITNLDNVANYLVMFTVALDSYENNRIGDALLYFDSAIKSANSASYSSEAYFYCGKIYYGIKNYDYAINSYSEAIRLNGSFADAYNNRGLAYDAKGNTVQAITDYTRAIEHDSYFIEAYNNRGTSYFNNGSYDAAFNDLNKAIQLAPNESTLYFNRGLAYSYTNNNQKSLDDYNEAIRLNSNYAEAYLERGNLYLALKDYGQAIENFTQAIQKKSQYAGAYYNRGNAYLITGRYDLAVDDFTKSIQLAPSYMADVYWNRGLAYEMLKDKDQAIKDFKKVLELTTDPSLQKKVKDEIAQLEGN